MRLLGWLQQHFWLPMCLALVMGVVLPGIGNDLKPTLIPVLVVILTTVFSKIDLKEVFHHLSNPRLMAGLLVLKLVIVPLVFYGLVNLVEPHYAVGVLLLLAMPPGASTPVFTDLVKGNTALCVSVYALSYFAAPFTITGLMALTGQPDLPLGKLFSYIGTLIFLPLALSQILRRFTPKVVEKTSPYYGGMNLLLITWLIFVMVSAMVGDFQNQAGEEGAVTLTRMIAMGAAMYLLFLALHLIGYYSVFKRREADRLAVSVTMTYMNTAFCLVVAGKFFGPEAVLVAVLSELPWSTMLGPFGWLHRKVLAPTFSGAEQSVP